MSLIYSLTAVLILQATFLSCKRDEKFPSLDDKFATPIDVAADQSGSYFYVLNSDDSRDYNTGSIITLTKDGERVGVNLVPRLGRSLTVAGNDMLVTFSNTGEDSPSRLELYDLTDPRSPRLTTAWGLDCNPINAVMRKDYQYFAVACSSGALYIGQLASPRTASQIHLVRQYPGARRAMYLDPTRNLLLAFTTDLRAQFLSDAQLEDSLTFSDNNEGIETSGSNEIPDNFEKLRNERRNKSRRGTYQHVVYDIAAEAAKGFPRIDDVNLLSAELRWTYFSLNNFDGSPDVAPTAVNANFRYYRTNFWEIRPDITDNDSFLLSHRGTSDSNRAGSPHANSVIRVRIIGDLRATGSTAPRTENVLSFERVYGFKGELEETGKHFPGDFELEQVNGAPLLVVNHFRDLKNFPASHYASIASKVLGEDNWFSELSGGATGHSYYQVALTSSGRAMAISFFQNLAILLDTAPGTAITEFKTIN